MTTTRLRAGLLSAALCLTLAATGCTPTAGPDGTATTAATPAELTVGLVLEPTDLDIRHTSGVALEQVLIGNVYEGLVALDGDGGIRPELASDYTVSEDGLHYDFTLNEGITFHDGRPVGAAEVVASLTAVLDDDSAVGHDALSSVSRVEEGDDGTVRITLSEPDSQLLWSLAGRPGLVIPVSDTVDLSDTAIGTGPFTLADWRQGDSITLDAYEGYWGTPPGLDGVTFQYITDPSAAVNAVLAGEVDVQTNVDPTLAVQLEDVDGVQLVEGRTTDVYTLAFNNAIEPFTDVRVRQALRQAIDHDALIAAVGGAGVRIGGPIPELDPGYEDLTDVVEYDPEAARQLLAEAGQDDLTLRLTIPNHYPEAIGTVLRSQFAEVGVTLEVTSVEFPLWLNDVYTNHDYELSMVDHAEARDFGNWANPDYYFGYDNPEVIELYRSALTATSDDEAADALARAARLVSEDHAGDWLYTATAITAVSAGVTGFPTDSTTARLDLSDVTLER
ncbi:ABC transporter substrate-binding protein [Mycetocola reblochoni]|uniref:Oligopeptide ABC transporter, periplasmic oligopeptide-binding protein OppA (TC 3.A.1.5.1) n=2 Tax=Mycetocola reblochoni TaxID=331618 RepID=A0A1R4JT29_9MICO|nr:ABC transporter substrate-binding protein [Mycetocola reblochoni]RLP70411.1 ABC transporter substrate-binding protein [Mycetocola reblochoni]SJN35177.1 Oligopeptide ABC transporter, periplasmic oligopeptide-binding protein OppA (TC 3.A.1.5.1) [Mycetocola reblochoni REB411]